MVPRPVSLPKSIPNPSLEPPMDSEDYQTHSQAGSVTNMNGNGTNGFNKLRLRVPMERRSSISLCYFFFHGRTENIKRYYASTNKTDWPPEVQDYNKRFTTLLEHIKARHDPTVTTVAQGVLEWKQCHNARHIGLDIQAWLDRFYMSRIGIRFLIGQRKETTPNSLYSVVDSLDFFQMLH